MAKELSVSIGHHAFGDAVESNNLLEVEIGNLSGIMSSVAWHKVSHLGETINNHHDSILVSLSPWESHEKIKGDVLPRGHGDRKWGIKAMR